MNSTLMLRAGATILLALGVTFSHGETAPAKPASKAAVKPASRAAPASPSAAASPEGKTHSLGNDSASGRLLTREELRACMKQRETMSGRLAELDAARSAADRDRAALTQEQEALKTERDGLGGVKLAAEQLAAKTKAFQAELDAWNKAVAEFNEAKTSGFQAERQRNELIKQSEGFKKRQEELSAERAQVLARGDEAVKAFNARAGSIDLKVAEWNDRNRKLNAELETLQSERQTWTRECGERRYREDDEKAILSGK